MCGIGGSLAVVTCARDDATPSELLEAKAPCLDQCPHCPEFAKTNCKRKSESCPRSCGVCEGLTPVKSNFCYDEFSNCKEFADKNQCHKVKDECLISCGLCR